MNKIPTYPINKDMFALRLANRLASTLARGLSFTLASHEDLVVDLVTSG